MLWEVITGVVGLLSRTGAFPAPFNQEDVFEILQERDKRRIRLSIMDGQGGPEAIEYIVASLQEEN